MDFSKIKSLGGLKFIHHWATCLDTTGVEMKVAFVGLMTYSRVKRPFTVSGILYIIHR